MMGLYLPGVPLCSEIFIEDLSAGCNFLFPSISLCVYIYICIYIYKYVFLALLLLVALVASFRSSLLAGAEQNLILKVRARFWAV